MYTFSVAHTGFSCPCLLCVKAALSQSGGQGRQQACAQSENVRVMRSVYCHNMFWE